MCIKIALIKDDVIQEEFELSMVYIIDKPGFKGLDRMREEEEFRKKHYQLFKLLTPRELEITGLLGTGLKNPEIAENIFISRYTVEQHRKNINRKLQINSLPQLLKYASAFDLI